MTTYQFVSPRDALDIVFADRNRAYGAYQLRRAYPRYLGRALGIGFMLIGLALVLPQILKAVSTAFLEPAPLNVEIMMGPPPLIENTPPPVVMPPASPRLERPLRRFVPPTVMPDEQVADDRTPAQELMLNTDADIGTKDRASDDDAPPSLDDGADFPPEVETKTSKPDEGEYNLVTVQKAPTFPGGEQALLQYLAENINYPALARENNIQGTVALSFVINKDGAVSDISILKEVGGGCGKEAMRVVQSMPRWSPGEANGHPVKVRFTLPVRFRLQ